MIRKRDTLLAHSLDNALVPSPQLLVRASQNLWRRASTIYPPVDPALDVPYARRLIQVSHVTDEIEKSR